MFRAVPSFAPSVSRLILNLNQVRQIVNDLVMVHVWVEPEIASILLT